VFPTSYVKLGYWKLNGSFLAVMKSGVRSPVAPPQISELKGG